LPAKEIGKIQKNQYNRIISAHDKATFIKANTISKQNPRAGIAKVYRTDALPLKVFAKDEISLSPFTGYHNKKKDLYYYKARNKGVGVNISAPFLNKKFASFLKEFEYDKKYKPKLKEALTKGLEVKLKDKFTDIDQNAKRIAELQGQIEKLEERFVLNEINKEQFEKFSQKYQAEKKNLIEENSNCGLISSNLEKAVIKGLDIVENISETWCSSDYSMKQTLQYLIFPEGILYNKKTDTVRTTRINSLFHSIYYLARISAENKKGNLLKDYPFGSNVVLPVQFSNLFLQDLNRLAALAVY